MMMVVSYISFCISVILLIFHKFSKRKAFNSSGSGRNNKHSNIVIINFKFIYNIIQLFYKSTIYTKYLS